MEYLKANETSFSLTYVNKNVTENGLSNSDIVWIVVDSIIILLILAGNILTICAIILSKKISEFLSNRYIFSLAVSDLMVGMTIPYHMAFTLGNKLNGYKTTCILRFVLTILACSSSIYNLLAIAADRYIAIVFPFDYGRYVTKKIVWGIILAGWVLAILIASMPIYWNKWEDNRHCTLEDTLPYSYTAFVMTPMFVSIWIAMLLLYFRIWREASQHAERLSVTKFTNSKQKKSLKENRSIQMVLLILGCFSICWLPYFSVTTYMRYNGHIENDLVYEIAFTLAMANSCMNPLIYAWKSTNYRKAFGCMLRCKSPRLVNLERYFITDHVPRQMIKTISNHEYDNKNNFELRCDGMNKKKTYEEQEHSDVTITTCVGQT